MTPKTAFLALAATAVLATPLALAAQPPAEAWEIGPARFTLLALDIE